MKNHIVTALTLGVFAIVGTAVVAFTYANTASRIEINERQALLRSLEKLMAAEVYDNDLLADTITIVDSTTFSTNKPITVYRARNHGEPVAAIITQYATNGYNGRIKLLVAIRYNGQLLKVRVVSHKETPGLGDRIEKRKSNWIDQFDNKSLSNPALSQWRVEKDGGAFDQLTAATISSRAIVLAVKQTLLYFAEQKTTLFAKGSP